MGKRGVSARYKPPQGLMKFPVLRAPLAKPPALPTCPISELAEKITRPHFLPFLLPSTELSGSSRLKQAQSSPCKDEQTGNRHQTHEKMRELKAEVLFEESEKVTAYEIKSLPGKGRHLTTNTNAKKKTHQNTRFDY